MTISVVTGELRVLSRSLVAYPPVSSAELPYSGKLLLASGDGLLEDGSASEGEDRWRLTGVKAGGIVPPSYS